MNGEPFRFVTEIVRLGGFSMTLGHRPVAITTAKIGFVIRVTEVFENNNKNVQNSSVRIEI